MTVNQTPSLSTPPRRTYVHEFQHVDDLSENFRFLTFRLDFNEYYQGQKEKREKKLQQQAADTASL
jgi:hypothetical protein